MAYIRKYKLGYRAEVERNGQRTSATFSTKREAQEWAAITERELLAGSVAGTYTVQETFDKYELEVSASKAGARWESLRLAVMLAYFEPGTLLSTIHPPQIAAWRDDRLKAASPATVIREANLLRNVFNLARLEWHWLAHNPFSGVKMPKEPEHRHQRWPWQAIKRVVRKLGYVTGQKPASKNQEVALAFMLTLRTSLRAAEVLRVSPLTFNVAKRVIVVKAKNKLRSEIPVTRQGARLCLLADFTLSSQSLDVLFRKARDATLAGDLTFHDGRATALTMLARKYDILTLARISQHTDLRMLQRYYRESSAEIAARL